MFVHLVSPHKQLTLSSSYGHLDLLRKGLSSTRPQISSSILSSVACPSVSPRTSVRLAPFPLDSPRASHCRTWYRTTKPNPRKDWSAADLTGRFPVPSSGGYEYLLIILHRNYIHAVPMSSRTSSAYISAFRSACRFFASLSHPLTHLILDNETSEDLSNFFRQSSPPIQFQHVPPANHRANPSERAIRTYKNHLISTLASTHISFPPDRWDLLLSHAELALNHFRSFSLDPSISAWHGLHRAIYDFSAHPLHPPGQLVVVHDSPEKRQSWARHGKRAFYLEPASSHYRCHRVFVPLNSRIRTSDTLDHFPDPLFPFEGPPFGGNPHDYIRLLENEFDILEAGPCDDSVQPRQGNEWQIIARRKAKYR